MKNDVYKSDYFKKVIKFENTISSTEDPTSKNLDNYPKEYRYFIENKKFDCLDFYRHYLHKHISYNYDETTYSTELINFFDDKIGILQNDFKKIFNNNNNELLGKLLKRRSNSFHFAINHQLGSNPLNQNMLQYYTKSYENNEFLIVWKYFRDVLNNEKFDVTLNNYKDKKGRLLKGNLISHISAGLKSEKSIRKIFDLAYPLNIRNVIDHNDYSIDLKNEVIRSIDSDKTVMSKNDFASTLYAIQTLQNLTLNYLTLQQFNNKSLLNEGVISVISGRDYHDKITRLNIFQLQPFYENDNAMKKTLSLNAKISDNHLVFFTKDKEVFRLIIDSALHEFYQKRHTIPIYVYSIFPNLGNKKIYQNIQTDKGLFYLDLEKCYQARKIFLW